MKKVRIGLFGAMINNDNMGCCALTYGLIRVLQRLANQKNYDFTYVIFERNPDKEKMEQLQATLKIDQMHLVSAKSARFIRFYNVAENRKCKEEIRKCNLVIDLTQGDSFTDIYGMERFISYTLDKLTVESCSVPLILGPQTYGPFHHWFAGYWAKKVIDRSYAVYSRDQYSVDYLRNIGVSKEIITVTDLAFGLPYHEPVKDNKKRAGINVSGLLWPDKMEATKLTFELKSDYRELTLKTVELLINNGYEVHLISHVGADYAACRQVHDRCPDTVLVEQFQDPVRAKTYIATMDIFIGARMHATIAALSSGVAVIPMSYSRKFQGLYNNLEYPYCIDLLTKTTQEASEILENYINNYNEVKTKTLSSSNKAMEKYKQMNELLHNKIVEILIRVL